MARWSVGPLEPATETLLRRKSREVVELRELLTPVAQELERLSSPSPNGTMARVGRAA